MPRGFAGNVHERRRSYPLGSRKGGKRFWFCKSVANYVKRTIIVFPNSSMVVQINSTRPVDGAGPRVTITVLGAGRKVHRPELQNQTPHKTLGAKSSAGASLRPQRLGPQIFSLGPKSSARKAFVLQRRSRGHDSRCATNRRPSLQQEKAKGKAANKSRAQLRFKCLRIVTPECSPPISVGLPQLGPSAPHRFEWVSR